jgi:hypothetical protein
VEDAGISTVADGGITELDPAGDRLLVDISGFADEWLHPLSRPISRRGNHKGPRNSGPRFPFWHASIIEDRPISGARACPLSARNGREQSRSKAALIQSPRRRGRAQSPGHRGRALWPF